MKSIKEIYGTNESIESSHDFFNDGHIESEFYRVPSDLRGIISWASLQLKKSIECCNSINHSLYKSDDDLSSDFSLTNPIDMPSREVKIFVA